MTNLIVIEGEVVEVKRTYGSNEARYLECDNGCEYIIFEDREKAGQAVREYYEYMKENDKAEFRCLIGDERLIQWACNESDSFGLSNFDEFLDAVENVPEEHFASYDGYEIEISQMNNNLQAELEDICKSDCVLYRTN